MQFQDQSKLFEYQAVNGWKNAKQKLMSQCGLFFRPYYTDQIQRQALVYPFAHAAQCVANAISIIYGVYLIGKSIVTLQAPSQTLSLIATTLAQCGNLILNLCNVLISLLSLGSRALATVVNRKYVFEPKYYSGTGASGPINQHLNEYQKTNELLQRTQEQVTAGELEENNRSLSLSFI